MTPVILSQTNGTDGSVSDIWLTRTGNQVCWVFGCFGGFLGGGFFKQKRADQDIVMGLFQEALPRGGREAGAEELIAF